MEYCVAMFHFANPMNNDIFGAETATEGSPWESRRLWSLWDMLERHGFLFAKAVGMLSDAKMMCLPLALPEGQPQVGRNVIENAIAGGLQHLRQACILADMDDVLPELDRLQILVWPPPNVQSAPLAGIGQAINHLVLRVEDDLQQQFFFHLSQEDVPLYGQKAPFGEKVAKRFKGAAGDVQNAGNCLALHQPTACVFHLMRAMEIAVHTLSRRLKITITPQTTWRQLTGRMDQEIRKMPDRTEAQKRKKNKWESASTNLHHVGSVWRNNTMHPATSYTRSQGHDVFNAVRVFMIDLAEL